MGHVADCAVLCSVGYFALCSAIRCNERSRFHRKNISNLQLPTRTRWIAMFTSECQLRSCLIPAAVPVVPLIPAFTPMNEFSPVLAFWVVFIACAIAALWASFFGPYIAKHHIEKKYGKHHAWVRDWVVTRDEVEKQGREQTAETARDRDEPPTVDNV